MANDFGGLDGPGDFDVERLSDAELDDVVDRLLRAHPELIEDPPGHGAAASQPSAGVVRDPRTGIVTSGDDVAEPVEVTVGSVEIRPPQQPTSAPVAPAAQPTYAPTEVIPIARAQNKRGKPWATPRHLGIGAAAALLLIGGLFFALQGRNADDNSNVATMPEIESTITDPAADTPVAAAPTPTEPPAPPTLTPTPVTAAQPPPPPTEVPSDPEPTAEAATAVPVATATAAPTQDPTATSAPTAQPTAAPTVAPTATTTPTPEATVTPTVEATATPTPTPTADPVPEILVGSAVAAVGCPYNASYENGLVSIDAPVLGDSQTSITGSNVSGAAHVELRIRSVDEQLYWIGSSWQPTSQSIFVPASSSWVFDAPLPQGTYCIVARGRDSQNGGSDRGNTIAFTVGPNGAAPIASGGGAPNLVNLVLSPGNGATLYASADIRLRVAPETTSFQIFSGGTEVTIDPAILADLLAGNLVVNPLPAGEYLLVGTSATGTDTHVLSVR